MTGWGAVCNHTGFFSEKWNPLWFWQRKVENVRAYHYSRFFLYPSKWIQIPSYSLLSWGVSLSWICSFPQPTTRSRFLSHYACPLAEIKDYAFATNISGHEVPVGKIHGDSHSTLLAPQAMILTWPWTQSLPTNSAPHLSATSVPGRASPSSVGMSHFLGMEAEGKGWRTWVVFQQ